MIAGGGMSASAVKEGAGARSQVANLVAWGATIVTVIVLTPLFKSLPQAVLGALIIQAVWHLIVARKLRRVRLLARYEWALGVTTLAGVLFFGVLAGMVIGLVLSLLIVISRASRPRISLLGSDPSAPGAYVDLDANPEAVARPGTLILRADQPLWYANALAMREAVLAGLAAAPATRAVVLGTSSVGRLDVTTADVSAGAGGGAPEARRRPLDRRAAPAARDFAARSGLEAALGDGHIAVNLDEAVRAAEQASRGDIGG